MGDNDDVAVFTSFNRRIASIHLYSDLLTNSYWRMPVSWLRPPLHEEPPTLHIPCRAHGS